MPWDHRRNYQQPIKVDPQVQKSRPVRRKHFSNWICFTHEFFTPLKLNMEPIIFFGFQQESPLPGIINFRFQGSNSQGFQACEMASLVKQRVANLHQEWTLMSHLLCKMDIKIFELGESGLSNIKSYSAKTRKS